MYDVLVIGGGVIGCAIARELSRRSGRICVVERNEDVCTGTSKANSAIVHAGFDAEPGTRKARFNVEGSRMMEALSRQLDFPYRRCGALVRPHQRHSLSLRPDHCSGGERCRQRHGVPLRYAGAAYPPGGGPLRGGDRLRPDGESCRGQRRRCVGRRAP